jgi:outer membrane protein OmpA-like peptidoglycan-associated protein
MMDQLSRDNEELQKALDDCNKEKAEAAAKKIAVVAPNLVTFKINKSNLSKEARANLGLLAEVIKENDSNVVYTITGYADAATGNKEINDRLSKERAQAVYDCLVNEFGVNPDQLRMDYKGGVENMFYDDPALSRAVITRGDLK